MYDKFRERLDELFENAPQTNRARELKVVQTTDELNLRVIQKSAGVLK